MRSCQVSLPLSVCLSANHTWLYLVCFASSIDRGSANAADVKEGLTAHFVDQYKEVFDLALQYQGCEVSAHHPASETALQQ